MFRPHLTMLVSGLIGVPALSIVASTSIVEATNAIDCLSVAEDRLLISENDRERLCRGAPTADGPIICFEAADDVSTLSNVQLIELCQCGLGTTPAECFEKGSEESDQPDYDIIDACRPISARNLKPDCTPIER